MRGAATLEEFSQNPVGSYFASRAFLYFFPVPAVRGFLLWGRPDDQDVADLFQASDGCNRAATEPFFSLIDASRFEGVGASAFRWMANNMGARMGKEGWRVRKQALVRPPGLPGALVGGFYNVVAAKYPVKVFATADEAKTWLGHSDLNAIDLDALWQQTNNPLLRELHAVLALEAGNAPTLDDIARRMSRSSRTLQRQLQDCGTNFQGELQKVRVELARKKIAETDLKLSTIAYELGFASLQHLSTLFRKLTGETPREYRKRQMP
jgi:AraC-like DNA-binding protein